jgi:hypothetical protein
MGGAICRAPGRLGRAIVGFFVRLGGVVVAPMEALGDAAAGRWPAARDGFVLIVVGALCCLTPEVTRVGLAAWDLGIREGVNELSWVLGRRLTPDLLLLLGLTILVVAPMRLMQRLTFDRALDLAVACWIPAFLLRLGGAAYRLHAGERPARLFEGLDWWAGLAWAGLLATAAFYLVLRDDGHD